MGAVVLIDGENLKGKIKAVFKDANQGRPIWHEYDFNGLFEKVLKGVSIDRKIFYTARIKEHEGSKAKSRQLIEEQRLLKTHLEFQGFEVVLSGRVRGQMEDGHNGRQVLVFREKGVDVKIAVDMVRWSCDGKVTEFVLASSDSDLQPAIQELSRRKAKCIYLGFETQPNKGLTYTTDRTILIRNSETLEFAKVQPPLIQ